MIKSKVRLHDLDLPVLKFFTTLSLTSTHTTLDLCKRLTKCMERLTLSKVVQK